jgi:hypothetical protein
MTVKHLSEKRKQGSVLVITLVTCAIVGIILASFLALISSRYKLTVRSMGWNAAIPVLEAGIEEALTHLHKTPENPSADGWTATTVGGQPVHAKRRSFPDGSYYYVAIYNAISTNPVIYSSGFTPSPLENGKFISRLVRVNTTNPPNAFIRAITTRQHITLGGNVVVDGYDSKVSAYNISTNRLANGGIATVSRDFGAVSVGGAHVYGTVTTGPGGTATVGNGAVGDVAWNASNKGIQPGWTNNDFNAAFSDNAPPSGGPFLPPTVTSVGGSNIMFLTTSTNLTTSLSLSKDSNPMIVTGNATLWVTGDVTISGTGAILIMPNASLTLYVGGAVKMGGGGVVNTSGFPSKFGILGLPGNTSITYNGNADFIGSIIAPQADVSMGGSTSMYGSVISKSFTAFGTVGIHYDKALGARTGLVVGHWEEL